MTNNENLYNTNNDEFIFNQQNNLKYSKAENFFQMIRA